MATETVTLEQEVTETELHEAEIIICDHCGLELDPQGINFAGDTQDNGGRYGTTSKKLDLCSKCYTQIKPETDDKKITDTTTNNSRLVSSKNNNTNTTNSKTEQIITNKEKFKNWWTYSKGTYTPRYDITIESVKKLTKELNSQITSHFIVSILLYIPLLGYSIYSISMLSNIGLSLLALLSVIIYFQCRIFWKSGKLRQTQKKVTEKLS